MNEIIKINETQINNETIQTVSARDLHEFLEVGKDFSNWVKARLEVLGSEENIDYLVFAQIGEKGGRPKIEYYLTLNTAKHFAMMEKNEKGKQIRDYFIECEKQLHAKPSLPQNYLEALKALVESEESRQLLLLENKQQAEYIETTKPKVYYYDIILADPSLVNIRLIAQDYGMSAQRMNKLLNEYGVQYRDKDGIWKTYAKYAAADCAKVHTTVLNPETPKQQIVNHLKWTQKGRLFIYDLLKTKGILPVCEQEG